MNRKYKVKVKENKERVAVPCGGTDQLILLKHELMELYIKRNGELRYKYKVNSQSQRAKRRGGCPLWWN